MSDYEKELEYVFEKANERFLKTNPLLFEMNVSERTLCGALMLELHEVLKDTKYAEYFVDVEYNRNKGGKLKTFRKTIKGPSEEIVTITCDLIVHSRGQNVLRDNLIALEMKKSTRNQMDKERDKIRLECLTMEPEDNVWSYGGKTLPEHVCGYGLGIYYEVNLKENCFSIEYYAKGHRYRCYKGRLSSNNS